MLSALLTQIQTQLLSKRFVLGSLLPLLLFLFATGVMLWRHYPSLSSWFPQIDNAKEGTIFFTGLTTALLILAYGFSLLNATLLECLEGKRGPAAWIGNLLYCYEQAKLQHLQQRYDAIAFNLAQIKTALGGKNGWIEQLAAARDTGNTIKECDPSWRKSHEARKVSKVLRRRNFGLGIPYDSLNAAVAALRVLLSTNSSNLISDASRKLAGTQMAMEQAIYFSRDRGQYDRIRLYNERQFSYPGNMNYGGPEPSPQNVLAPTTMGNIGNTMRSYAITRYNLDLEIFWSRIQESVQADKDYFAVLQDMKVQVDCFVALFWLVIVFAGIWTPLVFFKGSVLEFLLVGSSGFLSLALYSLACNAYRIFADLMRGTVDLYRFKLLAALHVPLPGGSEEEMLLWQRLGNKTGYARTERFLFKHTP